MNNQVLKLPVFIILAAFFGCSGNPQNQNKSQPNQPQMEETPAYQKGTFGYDHHFLQQNQETITLQDEKGLARVLVCPGYQGRVMTSTANGLEGKSFGWLNYDLIASGEYQPHINPYGGEERFWLGPEGGQYSLFFEPDQPFEFQNWQTPALIDTARFNVVDRDQQMVRFKKQASLSNYSNFTFDLSITRTIRLLSREAVQQHLGVKADTGLQMVAFESENQLTNTGKEVWQKSTGLLSIWILGMYQPGPETTIMIPFSNPDNDPKSEVVNDAYFGKVPQERLIMKGNMIYFKGDGRQRGKIGLDPDHAGSVAGSYDSKNQILTFVQYNKPPDETDYVNSLWELQDEPYAGDVVNAYNDGPLEDGSLMGPFYELETSSPAAALVPGASIRHIHRTFHFQGKEDQLAPIMENIFGVTPDEVKKVF